MRIPMLRSASIGKLDVVTVIATTYAVFRTKDRHERSDKLRLE